MEPPAKRIKLGSEAFVENVDDIPFFINEVEVYTETQSAIESSNFSEAEENDRSNAGYLADGESSSVTADSEETWTASEGSEGEFESDEEHFTNLGENVTTYCEDSWDVWEKEVEMVELAIKTRDMPDEEFRLTFLLSRCN